MNDTSHRRARMLGACIQGLILGMLLAIAILGLIEASTQASVFRYQGF